MSWESLTHLAFALVLTAWPQVSAEASLATQRPADKAVWTVHEVFNQDAFLRKELAELHTEANWLRSPPDRVFWTESEALHHFKDLHTEIAVLRKELAWLRQDEAGTIGELVRPTERILINGAHHGRTMFLTMCAGTAYFDNYCGPFLASFERAYGAAVGRHRVIVFTASVDERMLETARNRFGRWAQFEPLPHGDLTGEAGEHFDSSPYGQDSDHMLCELGEGTILSCNVTDEAVENRSAKISRNNFWFPFYIAEYIHNSREDFCYAVIIDSDTLFVRPFGHFLPNYDCQKDEVVGTDEWDVAFTVYDPDFIVPWATDAAEAGKTKHGFSRLNTGVLLLSLNKNGLAEVFLHRWGQVTAWIHDGGEEALGMQWQEEEKLRWLGWRSQLLEEFKGPNQAGLVLLLCSYQTERLPVLLGWGPDCGACAQTVEARLDFLEGETPTKLNFRALPARILNHPESMPEGRFPSDIVIVHLKGLWWRRTLPRGSSFFVNEHRRIEWNFDTLALHWLLYETWHFDLPPEVRPKDQLIVKDSKGQVVSNRELQEKLERSRGIKVP